jgi:nucleotide-binding universal stress UspA family protein
MTRKKVTKPKPVKSLKAKNKGPNKNKGQNQNPNKMKTLKGQNWIVAIDPFSDLDLSPIWNFAKPLAQKQRVTLNAVYVLAPSSLNWTGDFSGPWQKKYRPMAETKLNEVVRDGSIKKLVLTCQEAGLRPAVETFVKYARKIKASGLIVSTHARHGFDLWTMGSFAETLILVSKIPVWVINPAYKVPTHVRKILVPIDFSNRSRKFVESLGTYAKKLDAELLLYHKLADPLDPIIQQGVYSLGGGWVSVQSYIDTEQEQNVKRMDKMETALRKKNIKATPILDSSPGGLVESIDQAARDNGADLIAVMTRSGPITAALLGSVARGLVRSARVPVLIEH